MVYLIGTNVSNRISGQVWDPDGNGGCIPPFPFPYPFPRKPQGPLY